MTREGRWSGRAMAKNKRRPPRADQNRLVESIPQRFDVWQADFRQTPEWINVAGRPVRPWIVLVTSRTDELVLGHEIIEEPPTSKGVWDVLAEVMLHPPAGSRHRPSALQVRPNPIWHELDHQFDALGITVVKRQLLDHWDSIFKDMTTHLCGNIPLGILEMPGMQPAHVASFYRTAAKFYLVWELELLQGCLHAVLSFVARHSCDDSSTVDMTVPVASGDLNLRLSWVDC
jgi:hypothetical protein